MRSHSFGSDRLVTGLPLSMRYAFLALRRGMLRVGCNSSKISSMSAIEWRGKRLLLVGACRPILQILTLFQTKKVSLCKILGVLADNLYYDGALVHEPDYFWNRSLFLNQTAFHPHEISETAHSLSKIFVWTEPELTSADLERSLTATPDS